MRTILEMSADSKLLIARLAKISVGEIVQYEDLSHVIGCDIRARRGPLYCAFRVLLRDQQMMFGSVRGQGIKRLDDHEKILVGTGYQTRAHKTSRRGIRVLASVNYDGLCNKDKIAHNAALSLLGAINLATSHHAIKRLEAAVESAHSELPSPETLKLLAR